MRPQSLGVGIGVKEIVTGDQLTAFDLLANSGTQGQKSDAIRRLIKEVRRFRKKEPIRGPALSDVMKYAEKIGMKNPESFYDHHKARGWMLGPRGTVPMRDFESAMRTWNRTQHRINESLTRRKDSHGVG